MRNYLLMYYGIRLGIKGTKGLIKTIKDERDKKRIFTEKDKRLYQDRVVYAEYTVTII